LPIAPLPPPPSPYQIKHFEHAWLKESWATYMECCWLEVSEEGDDAFLYQVRNGASAWAGLSFLSTPHTLIC